MGEPIHPARSFIVCARGRRCVEDQYYKTALKPIERPHETLNFAVLDNYSHIVAYCETEDRATLLVHALNNYVSSSESVSK